MGDHIQVRGARQNNLKNLDLDIPKNRLVAITGVSGSGKSSLAYDTIFQEAQRQLLETFSTYSRRLLPRYERPDVDRLGGLGTAIVIDQKRVGRTSRSTVGTFTEAWTMLRLLFARCGEPNPTGDSNVFSFNRPEGMCPACSGVGHQVEVDADRVMDWSLSLSEGAIRHPDFRVGGAYHKRILACGLDVDLPAGKLSRSEKRFLLYSEKHRLKNHDANRYFNITFEGVIKTIERRWLNREIEDNGYGKERQSFLKRGPCRECQGSRLCKRALKVKVAGLSIAEMAGMEIHQLRSAVATVEGVLAQPVVLRVLERLDALIRVGVGYLSLDRATATLSGGESQRVKMARQLGCELEGLIYILDEPTVGLHPHDIDNLLDMLYSTRDRNNSVLVVEHDPAVIGAADHVIDLGPGAGSKGGEVVFSGSVDDLRKAGTQTSFHLERHDKSRSVARRTAKSFLPLENVSIHNLKDVSVDIPEDVLVCVTGVSGSGKSTLITNYFVKQHPWAIVVDQSPVGRSRRSNPATYTGAFNDIRAVFATANAVKPSLFSFNSAGACSECKGMGRIEVEMRFLDPVRTVCSRCEGRRYEPDILKLGFQGRSIADVLEMTVADAADFFADSPAICQTLAPLQEVGLGYLSLGQELSTMSGGEAQRLKLARNLVQRGQIYVLDEPTTGLHMSDIGVLLKVLHRLVDEGNSVIVIEHNLDVIRAADWIIDLGPGGGEAGGRVLAKGTPEQVANTPDSVTGRYLKRYVDA